MDSSHILAILDSTKEFDTVALARSTQKAIEIIMPWCQMEASSTTVAISQEIRNQVQVYARAIDTSVEAAQMGFTIAEDAISLVESIKDSETKPEERREFLDGIISFTAQGLEKAKEARKGFLEVRTTVHNLLDQMKVENEDEAKIEYAEILPNGLLNKIRKPFFEVKSELGRGIKDLEEFGEMLSKFAAWWNGMVMETQSQLTREQQVSTNLEGLDKLRIRAIEQKWKNHKNRYAAYVNEIGIVQDRYPKLLKGADPHPATGAQNPTTERSSPNNTWTQYPGTAATPSPVPSRQNSDIVYPEAYNPQSGYTSHFPHHQCNPSPYRVGTPPPPPAYSDHRPPLRTYNTILSHEISSSCYVSASMTTVQVLEKNKCLLILEFQCHTSSGRRFDHMSIKWNFKDAYGTHPPMVLHISPRQSIGARNEENHHRTYGLKVPVQFTMAGATAGPEANAEIQIKQKVERAMIITGSIRGQRQDSAEWTLEENSSAMSGIPSHFCVAAVIQYTGPFFMDVAIRAKQRALTMFGLSRRAFHDIHAKSGPCHIDADNLQRQYEPYKPSANWKQWFPLISGEVEGFNNVHPQEALRRG
ncbi:hypothetical protein CPC08DRAFT_820739 [Agrocybe pediades]|nr:hypothetical protein CPC08DRAFT_820739 [Agrocybe pediades]